MNEKIQGWINLYKPVGISSFSAIYKIKKKFNIKKLGHAGTLDFNAEGILPIAINKTTKLIPKPKSKFSGFLELTNFLIISESLIGKPKDWLYSINWNNLIISLIIKLKPWPATGWTL